MPVVTISVKKLNGLLKKEYPMNIIVESLEQLGCDVEDTVDIDLYGCPACGTLNDKLSHEEAPKKCTFCGFEGEADFEKYGTDSVIRIDLLANRPDLFNVSGLSRALKGYLGLETGMPVFECKPGLLEVKVDPSVLNIRPYIVCAEVELPAIDQATLRELMKIQENLHWGVGRDRKLASIGIYNLDTISGPITYTSVDPKTFKFHPLTMPDKEMTPQEVLEKHPKGTAYAHLLENFERFPLLMDSKGLTLSMPPIINSDETKCKVGSTRFFIDVTGTGEHAVTDALNILVCALTELGGTVKTVKINFPGNSIITPQLTPGKINVSHMGASRWIGVDLTKDEFLSCMKKMRLDANPIPGDNDRYEIEFPVYRSDIRHEIDIFEDVIIGYGVSNVPLRLVPTMTVGMERSEERIGNLVRSMMTGLNFNEVMTLNLNSEENHFTKLRMEAGDSFVCIENPKTVFQKVLRTHLITGILETFEKNRKKPVPQRMFEIGTVTKLNPEKEVGIDEFRHLAFGILGPGSGYAEGRAVLDSVLRELGLKGIYQAADHPAFIEGRYASVKIMLPDGNESELKAVLGEIHPEVLNNFNLDYPIVFCELALARVY